MISQLINLLTSFIILSTPQMGEGIHQNQLSHYRDDSGMIQLSIDNLSSEFLEYDPKSIRMIRDDSYSFQGWIIGNDGEIRIITLIYDDLEIHQID